MYDFMYKATNKAAWGNFAQIIGFTDENGFPSNCYIDEIGPIVTTPATFDEEGQIITEAIIDNHHHVNVRVTHLPQTIDEEGNVTGPTYEDYTVGDDDVEWIDPDIVNSPSRIFAGGMRYWKPDIEAL